MSIIAASVSEIPHNWRRLQRNGGQVEEGKVIRLKVSPDEAAELQYTNAQIDDHPDLKRSEFLNSPPLKLKLEARLQCDGHPRGTAGFGFWNDPFLMTDSKIPTLPKAVWFFWCSEDSEMQLAQDIPGHGWKMAVIDAWHWPFLALIPTVPLSVPLMWWNKARRCLWPIAQKAMKCQEKICPVSIFDWHEYEINWGYDRVRFFIDGRETFSAPAPKGPLGLVIWIDNQFMRIDPRGVVKHGNLSLNSQQSLNIRQLELIRG